MSAVQRKFPHHTAEHRRVRLQIVVVIFHILRQLRHGMLSAFQLFRHFLYFSDAVFVKLSSRLCPHICQKLYPVQMYFIPVTVHIQIIRRRHRLVGDMKFHPLDVIAVRGDFHRLPVCPAGLLPRRRLPLPEQFPRHTYAAEDKQRERANPCSRFSPSVFPSPVMSHARLRDSTSKIPDHFHFNHM